MKYLRRIPKRVLHSTIAVTMNTFGGMVIITSLGLRFLVSSRIAKTLAKVHNWIRK